MATGPNTRAYVDWLRPAGESQGLTYYVSVIRERVRLIAAVVILSLAAAGAYLWASETVYEAEAVLLVTPVSADDPLLISLGALPASNDPTRDVETVASLATSQEVSERAQQLMGEDISVRALRDLVTAEPVASSNLIAVEAQANSAQAAADRANAFATAIVELRTDALHRQAGNLLTEFRARLDAGGSSLFPGSTLEADIARLEVLRTTDDPTVRVEAQAVPPASAVAPRHALILIGAAIAGLGVGVAAAFAVKNLDPRLRREEQLRTRYRIPILARVPREHGRKNQPLSPGALSMPAREAYRTLRANVAAARRNPRAPHSILVTGSTPSEGKTTTAINLAGSLALAGNKVILIEADLRRPAIANALGVEPESGVVNTLLENVALDDALVATESFGPGLQLLLADYRGGWMSELFSLHAAQRLLAAAKARADYVIVDSPPLTSVVDTLPLARAVDDVLIVSRLGVTRLDVLPELAELITANGITPLGFVLIGAERADSYYYREDDPEDGPESSATHTTGHSADRREPVRPRTSEGEQDTRHAEHARWS